MCKRIKDGDEGADRCGGRERPTRTKARRAKGERDEKRRNEEKEEWREYGENQERMEYGVDAVSQKMDTRGRHDKWIYDSRVHDLRAMGGQQRAWAWARARRARAIHCITRSY